MKNIRTRAGCKTTAWSKFGIKQLFSKLDIAKKALLTITFYQFFK
jgi:hypothetical protein